MTVRITDYPQLERLCWNLPGVTEISEQHALAIYERAWRHVDEARLDPREQALIHRLARDHGGGHLCV